MSHKVVKILINEDGDKSDDNSWHYYSEGLSDFYVLCSMELLHDGCGVPDKNMKIKSVEKGGITCKDCLEIIKTIKSIKL